ncbi:MAG TPA: low temperature requirement protein A [Streptosporangiaceae bacterium]|nr:low temperature requirement protein A [Streptosporangiaceae bacterium]
MLAQAEPGADAADGAAGTSSLPDGPAGLFLMAAPATTIFAPAGPGCDGARRPGGCDHETGHPMPAATARPDHGTTAPVIRARSRLARLASTPVPVIRLTPPLLRTAGGHHRDERSSSWLELFFDLVFAGAVSQLAGALQDHPSLGSLARFVMLFTPIWWLWVQFAFYADRHESNDATHRGAFLAAILLCVGLAASAPRALSGDTTGFVIAFACLRALQLLLYARARRHLPATSALYTRYLIFFGAGGALWLSSLAAAGTARYAFWGAALLTDAAGALTELAPGRRVPLNPGHLADRFQLFVLIVLGESIARLISAATMRPWSLPLAVVLAAALLTLAALWAAWHTTADRDALDSPPAIARFTAASLPIVAGVAAASAGLHIAILAADGAATIGDWPRAALYGGVSIYLLASATLPSRKMTRWARAARLAASLAAMGLVFMGAIVMPVYLVPALTAVLALGLAAESHPGWGPAITSQLDIRRTMPRRATRRPSPHPAGSPAARVTQ